MSLNFKKISIVSLNFFVQIAITASAFVLLYYHAFDTLIYDWSNNPNFSHGFLIPFVAAYMVWFKKNELKEIKPEPSNSGLVVLGFAMVCFVAGTLGSELFVMRSSMIITLFGLSLFFFGRRITAVVAVPILYLLIMIPIPAIIWNKLAFPLQLFAANLSAGAVSILGIPVFREGNILHLANTSLEVVDACSGLRSLTSLLALSGAFAFIAPLGTIKKWVLFLSAIPIAVVVNIVRLTITALMATYMGPEAAHGFLHDMSGILVFAVALILVYAVFALELKLENR